MKTKIFAAIIITLISIGSIGCSSSKQAHDGAYKDRAKLYNHGDAAFRR